MCNKDKIIKADEILSQYKFIKTLIEDNQQEIARQRDLATNCTSTLSDMPKSTRYDRSITGDAVCETIDFENENKQLIQLARSLYSAINSVKNVELQAILKKQYICDKTWKEIAKELNYSERQIYRKQDETLEAVKIPDEYK